MSFTQGTGGASIKPSARRSIHSHRFCPFNENNMVRYGISDNFHERDLRNEQGTDEVDNIISKPVNPIRYSPLQRNKLRRNSLRTNTNQYTDDDTDVLSKSLPTTLPSQLHCSDDSNDEQKQGNEQQFSDVSFHSFGTPNRSNVSKSFTSSPHTVKNSSGPTAQVSESNQTPHMLTFSKITLLLVGVLASVYASMFKMSTVSKISTYDELKFYSDISGLGEKYNVDDNTILQVQIGISTIFKNQDTGSFIIVYNSDIDDFDPSAFNKFVNEISFAASKYLRNESTPLHYTAVEGTKLDMQEHSELIARYREDLDKTGVMLVRHVEAIPSDLAMAFHYYCDEFNPLVKKSAIFFTMNLAKCPEESGKRSFHTIIEKCLAKKWNSVPIDSIGPLLTRVVSVVINVTGAF